ncbi:thiamine biosynthesis protein ThiS [Helicobacter didelphidarum]|uniref:Thiamine biosynthesis protein ThiS n=1 Tax=Helicobacter didelphidarum TaxID=2040648 RepID=A0A3D8IR19_9HELI|nr:sulfur carrier protein ThiS [Helicobacter didelphidarum]RDU67054.1 thiamine biosynthesis protein ThiS [Helicobacter didelphidarum]
MQIILNGKNQVFPDNITISQILTTLNIQERVVAIALNSNVVKKESWEKITIKEHDCLELLQFTSGG